MVSDKNPVGILGFEFIEYASANPEDLAKIFKDLGFDAVDSFVVSIIETLDFTEILFEPA